MSGSGLYSGPSGTNTDTGTPVEPMPQTPDRLTLVLGRSRKE